MSNANSEVRIVSFRHNAPLLIIVTDVKVEKVSEEVRGDGRLLAYADFTINGVFLVREAKIIEGNERTFVAMPSRRVTVPCPACGTKNHVLANYCNDCGGSLDPQANQYKKNGGRHTIYREMAFPLQNGARETIESAVLAVYRDMTQVAK